MRVAIIGAGVTGLTLARLLLRGGADVTLYEASKDVGGLGGSYRRDGFTFDFGPHEFCTQNPVLLELMRDVCGDDLLQIDKHTAQYFRGKFLHFPFELGDVLRNVGPRFVFRAMFDVTLSKLAHTLRPPTDDSFETWTRARFGRTLYEDYFGPYTKKVWGITPNALDPVTASDRITVDSIWHLARRTLAFRLFGKEDREHRHSELRKSFLYTRGGIGTLQRHLLSDVIDLGGHVEHEKRLVKLDTQANRVEALRFEDGTEAGGFDSVASTIPLPKLVHAALGQRAAELLDRCAIPFRGMAFQFLRLAKPKLLDYHWSYFADADIPFQRITEFTHFDTEMVRPGQTGLAVEVSCQPGDRVWSSQDDELIRNTMEVLERLGLAVESELIGADVVRVPFAYPIQIRGFRERADALVESLSGLSNLVTLGRQGLFRYCNMDECMEMAIDVAPRMLAAEPFVRCEAPTTWVGVGITDNRDAG